MERLGRRRDTGQLLGFCLTLDELKGRQRQPGRAWLGGRTRFGGGHSRVRACERLPELRRECVQLSKLGLLEVPQRVIPREDGVSV